MNSNKLNLVEVLPHEQKVDHRGWLIEVLRKEQVNGSEFGQIYLTTAHPAKRKGNHYHTRKTEWFCVVKGMGRLVLEDVETKERSEILMGEERLVTVKIPPGVAHMIENAGNEMMYLVIFVNETFSKDDPDTFPYEITA